MVLKHKRQMLHIDLIQTTSNDAASLILSWIKLQQIKILNVAGPRASKDSQIYGEVIRIIEMAYVMHKAERLKSASRRKQFETVCPSKPPKTVEEAIDRLATELSLKDKTAIANMTEDELDTLNGNLGVYIWNEFGFWSGNQSLLDSCHNYAKGQLLTQDRGLTVIIRELWKRLIKTHRLRVVK
jgi:hypothetical protein